MFNRKFKQLLTAAIFVALCFGVVVAKTKTIEKAVKVQISTNLYQDAQLAKQKGVPLVVMFSQKGCIYCTIVREDFLKPMLISGEYENKAIIREMKIDSFEEVRNFDGKMIAVDELATFYRAYLTPTVIVFDSTGKPHHRILGLVNEHYYSSELDAGIEKAYNYIHRVALNN